MMTGRGVASAATALQSTAQTVAAGLSPTSEATALRTLHDSLESQWNAKDATGMQATQTALVGELAKLQTSQGHAAMTPDGATSTTKAVQQNTELGQDLAALAPTHGQSAGDLPLPVPGLGSITSLVTGLLGTLLAIITGLLGGLPVPVPPVPGVPAAG
jgi:hypothetical protein